MPVDGTHECTTLSQGFAGSRSLLLGTCSKRVQHCRGESTDGAPGQAGSAAAGTALGSPGARRSGSSKLLMPLDLMAILDRQFTAGSNLFLLGKLHSGAVSVGSESPKYSGLFCNPNV